MAWRDLIGRYRGSILGLFWSFFNPLFMLATYTFVFGFVLKARWGAVADSPANFALFLFVGLIIHMLFSECVNRAPSLVTGNVNYVKKVVFPLEILVWPPLGSALFHSLISTIVLVAFLLILKAQVFPTTLLLPLILFPLLVMTAGFTWFIAATAVYVRDVEQTTGLLTLALLFLSPVFYPQSALPENMQPFLLLSPLTFVIEECRKILLLGEMPNWKGLAVYGAVASLVAWAGFAWFQKARKGFADVL